MKSINSSLDQSFLNLNKANSRLNKKFTTISNHVKPESALFSMINLILQHHDQINIIDSIISINSNDLDLFQKLNYLIEYFTHIPISFHYDKTRSNFIFDFVHLQDEINLINNMETLH